MQIDIDLRSYLATNLGIGVEQNKIAEDYNTSPALMFQRRPSTQDLFLNGTPSINETNFDIEIYGIDIDAVETTTDTAKTLLNGFKGTMGSTFVLGAFVTDHEDDYTPKVELQNDEGLNVCTFALQIIY